MKKYLIIWLFSAAAGVLFVLLLNTSPLARVGLTIELPGGWEQPADTHINSACKSRRAEGIPFAFRRPNETQTCTFDTSKLGLVLNAATGIVIGCLHAVVIVKGSKKQEKEQRGA